MYLNVLEHLYHVYYTVSCMGISCILVLLVHAVVLVVLAMTFMTFVKHVTFKHNQHDQYHILASILTDPPVYISNTHKHIMLNRVEILQSLHLTSPTGASSRYSGPSHSGHCQ